jgi:hypothetical protein
MLYRALCLSHYVRGDQRAHVILTRFAMTNAAREAHRRLVQSWISMPCSYFSQVSVISGFCVASRAGIYAALSAQGRARVDPEKGACKSHSAP